MYIHCVNTTNSYTIHGIRKETMIGDISETICTIAVEEKRGILGNSSKLVCQFLNNSDGREKSNFELFAEESQEALSPFCIQLDGHRICKSLLGHDKIYRKWESLLPVIQSKYSGEWLEEQLVVMSKRIYDKEGLYHSLCRHFIFSEWLIRDIFSIDFMENRGTREQTEYVFDADIVFKQDCFLKKGKFGHLLVIEGISEIEPGDMRAKELWANYDIEKGNTMCFEQHIEWEGEDLSRLPESIRSSYTMRVQGESVKTIEIELKFQKTYG